MVIITSNFSRILQKDFFWFFSNLEKHLNFWFFVKFYYNYILTCFSAEQDSFILSNACNEIHDRICQDFCINRSKHEQSSLQNNDQIDQQDTIKQNKFLADSENLENEEENMIDADENVWSCERCGTNSRENVSEDFISFISGSPSMDL